MKHLFIALAIFGISISAHAEADANAIAAPISAPAPMHDGFAAKGLRVALVKPFLTVDYKFSGQGISDGGHEGIDQVNGASVGYAYLPIRKVGYTGNLSYLDVVDDGFEFGMIRVDGNVAYTFSPVLNVKAGINLAQFNKSEMRKHMKVQPGLQASVGMQFNRNFGVDAGAVLMRQKGQFESTTEKLTEAGPEVSVTGTF